MLNKMSIKVRLTLLVSAAFVLLLSIGLLGMRGLWQSEELTGTIYEERMLPSIDLAEISTLMLNNRLQLFAALQHDPQNEFSDMHQHSLTMHTELIEKEKEELNRLVDKLREYELGPEGEQLFTTIESRVNEFQKVGIEPALNEIKQGNYADSNVIILQKVNPLFNEYQIAFDEMESFLKTSSEQTFSDAKESTALQIKLATAMIILGSLFLFSIAYFIIRGINQGVSQLDTAMNQLVEGDLTVRIQYDSNDELGQIVKNFNQMAGAFRNTMGEFGNAANQLAAAAEETNQVSEETNCTIQEQQVQTTQVATAINEMSATVHDVANNSSQAAIAAKDAHQEASSGQKVVRHTIEVITELATEVEQAADVIATVENGSEQIGSILDVIKNIADQTNLLALNAAIEAARAGDQGRGFAVVADEVRTLASRTQQSTTEIEAMIATLQSGSQSAVSAMKVSLERTQQGVSQAEKAGQALQTIFDAITTINDMNTQIASASEQQSSVTEDINQNISAISEMAERTATGASQTTSSSQELARLAEQLQCELQKFRT